MCFKISVLTEVVLYELIPNSLTEYCRFCMKFRSGPSLGEHTPAGSHLNLFCFQRIFRPNILLMNKIHITVRK